MSRRAASHAAGGLVPPLGAANRPHGHSITRPAAAIWDAPHFPLCPLRNEKRGGRERGKERKIQKLGTRLCRVAAGGRRVCRQGAADPALAARLEPVLLAGGG